MKTMEEYFQFLEQYWQMFTAPTERSKNPDYKHILL